MTISRRGSFPPLRSMRALSGARMTKMRAASHSRIWKFLGVLLVGIFLSQSGIAQNTGINFPPTQGSSGTGAFQPGIYNYSYTNAQIAAANATFNMMRLPINVETANDPTSLAKLKGYVDQFAGHYAIICMFGTLQPGQTGHGNGLPNGLSEMAAAWANINAVFASYPNVHYEIFNEPFGYDKSDPAHYVSDMETIINQAGLPYSKCILDGMGYADDVNLVAAGGWSGDLAYHFYPTWLSSNPTQSNYSNLAQAALGSWGQKTWVTEFGANLGYNNTCYDTYDDGTHYWSADVNTLRGLDDALRALKADGHGVKGAFAWHGWNNGDSYDYWASINANGACKVREIETHD
jgi:hypothetical protein